ncbi:MAG: carboxypeptidase-like regulatory domain-containing protein [Ferruginibacter sp.]|nr:carboxypeptidase-like regulatory domain-containing protein [Chitinophagaceae bacterium]
MSPSDKGRFCGSCQKTVVDFTNLSDRQVAAFFKKPGTGSVCGRFMADQLERPIEIPRKRIPWVRYFFQIALPAFLMSAKASAQGKAGVVKNRVEVNPSNVSMGLIALPVKDIGEASQVAIKGKVVDDNNKPVSFASIMVKGTSRGVAADSMGLFRMEKILLQSAIVLEISRAGYEIKEITITRETDLTQELVIQLSGRELPEVVVSSYEFNCRSQVMGGISVSRQVKNTAVLFEELPEVKPPKETLPMIKVYPNPVSSGTAINIGCEKLAEGYYTFQLVSQAGQQVSTNQIWIDKEARLMNLEIPVVTAGTYILTLTNKESGKKFTEKVVIQ